MISHLHPFCASVLRSHNAEGITDIEVRVYSWARVPTEDDIDSRWVDIADLAEWSEKEVGSNVEETESRDVRR